MSTAKGFPDLLTRMTGRGPLRGVPLREYTNFRIGGPADYFFEARSRDELRGALGAAHECGVPPYVIGGGYNLLFDDAGFRGLIVRNAVSGLALDPSGPRVRAESGTLLGELVEFAAGAGLEGMEYLAGIPGSVGGAIYGNAGAFGHCSADVLAEVLLLRKDGSVRIAVPADLGFAYRHSALKSAPEIILQAAFDLRPGSSSAIRSRMGEYLGLRAAKHPPLDTAYAGSYFKNPPLGEGTRRPAGQLLEQVGAKETRVGGAAVYAGHANFLYNTGNATAKDVLALAALLKKRVKEAFGIDLEEEVIHVPAVSSAP
jgi:UDP-N-acetylmuramate dehydrogenase